MDIYLYTIKLIDPLFYAREGMSGAFTPQYVHATAMNHAFASAVSQNDENQPYITAEQNGGANIPRYSSSLISKYFYLTPARLKSKPNYYAEIVKGDGDRLIQLGYGASGSGKNEVLKAYHIYSLAPESILEGYLYTKLSSDLFPSLLRLGSFRGIVHFDIEGPYKIVSYEEIERYCDHPVDPLVCNVIRGIPVSMLPYPVCDQALVDKVWEISYKKHGQRTYVAALPNFKKLGVQPIEEGSSLIM